MANPPTLDEYFKAADKLAQLLREAFDHPGSISGSVLREALERYERLDARAS